MRVSQESYIRHGVFEVFSLPWQQGSVWSKFQWHRYYNNGVIEIYPRPILVARVTKI